MPSATFVRSIATSSFGLGGDHPRRRLSTSPSAGARCGTGRYTSRSSTPPWVAGVGGGRCALPAGSERGHRGLGDGLVLFTGATADPDGADDLALVLQRYPTREDHHPSLVGDVDAEELRTGLCVAGQFTGRDVEGTGGEGLVDGDVHATDPGPVHPRVRDQIAAC